MIFIDQREEGGWQDVFLPEGAFFVWGGFWAKEDFCRSGVSAGGVFCPVPIDNNGGYTKY